MFRRLTVLLALLVSTQIQAQETQAVVPQPVEVQVQPAQTQPVQPVVEQAQPVVEQAQPVQPVQQAQPVQPVVEQTQPAQPVQPVVEQAPVQPVQPVVEQTQPAQPVQPVVEQAPVQPVQPVIEPAPVQAQPQVAELNNQPVLTADPQLLGKWTVDIKEVKKLEIYQKLNAEQQEEVLSLLSKISLEWTQTSAVKAIFNHNEVVGSYEIQSKNQNTYIIKTTMKNATEVIEFEITGDKKAVLNPKTKILPLEKI